MLSFYLAALETEDERDIMTQIFNEHGHVLMKYAMKLTGNRNMAEDVFQDTILAIIQNKEKYFKLSCRDFRFSAVSIVKNKCIDLWNRQQHFADKAWEDMEMFLEDESASMDEQMIRTSQYEEIRWALTQIDEISKQVLIMKYNLLMSYREIGTELGMTEKHVETRLSRAKAKVRNLISKNGGEKNE